MEQNKEENFEIEVLTRLAVIESKLDDYKKLIESSKFNILEFRDWHKSKMPPSNIQKILEEKYNRKNFSTVSIKMLLEK